MRIYYDGARIFNSGLINGSGKFAVDYGPGVSTNVIIIMNEGGNPNQTEWTYTVTQITRQIIYATFTENTNLTTTPIKFALPPFGGLPVEPLNSGSEVGSSALVEPGFGGVDNFRFILCLGPRHEGRHHHQRRASEFHSALQRHMPGQERAEVCRACAAVFGTRL